MLHQKKLQHETRFDTQVQVSSAAIFDLQVVSFRPPTPLEVGLQVIKITLQGPSALGNCQAVCSNLIMFFGGQIQLVGGFKPFEKY